MADTVRYLKSESLLRLALKMANTRQGLSLTEIQEEFEIGRRTAERMRDAILRIFPDTIEKREEDRIKRWHIPRQKINDLVSIQADDLTALSSASRLVQSGNMQDMADRLDGLGEKLKSCIDDKSLRRIEPDLEALIEAEGLALRQGPRPVIDTTNLEILREAVKACREVVISYIARGSGMKSHQNLQPYGFIYGSRHYLVGYSPEQQDFRLYSLPNIEDVEIKERSFQRRPDFDLQAYANRSFGVFQEEPVNVVWQVSPEAAEDARHYLFHPTQKFEERPDGGLIVRFTAGGMLEMCWELFKWDGSIRIIEPDELKTLYAQTLNQ